MDDNDFHNYADIDFNKLQIRKVNCIYIYVMILYLSLIFLTDIHDKSCCHLMIEP